MIEEEIPFAFYVGQQWKQGGQEYWINIRVKRGEE
jgi:hypothetical protein